MATSRVDIYNQALVDLGSDASITSPTEASVPAQTFEAIYEASRLATLEGADWRWASMYFVLAKLDGDSPSPDHWTYWYQMPGLALVAREIIDPSHAHPTEPIPFEPALDTAQGRILMCDLENPRLRATSNVTDVNIFPGKFVESIAFLLASKAAMKITGNPTLQQGLFNAWRLSLSDAEAAAPGVQQPLGDSSFITARI